MAKYHKKQITCNIRKFVQENNSQFANNKFPDTIS